MSVIKVSFKNDGGISGTFRNLVRDVFGDTSNRMREAALAATKELLRGTPVWTGETQQSITISSSESPVAIRTRARVGTAGTNFLPIGAEPNSNPSVVLSRVGSFNFGGKGRSKLHSFYIHVNSNAVDAGLYDGVNIPGNSGQHSRVPSGLLSRVVTEALKKM